MPVSPELYFLSGRRNPFRFFSTAFGIRNDAALAQVVAALESDPPPLVFVDPGDKYMTDAARKVVEVVRPARRPRINDRLQHLQVPVPVPRVDVGRVVAELEPRGEALQRRHPRPELVDAATELPDADADLIQRRPGIVRRDVLPRTRNEVVRGRVDLDIGGDGAPDAARFVGETDPHQFCLL